VVWLNIPVEVAALLAGRPVSGQTEQAFPFLTIDNEGFPHSALLSRAEMDVGKRRQTVVAALASQQTRANLLRDGRAGFIAIGGEVAHHIKLSLRNTLEANGLLGCVFDVVNYKADTLGIPLEPMMFQASDVVARLEKWTLTEGLLHALMS
jgi:hypothetical protein